MLRSARVITFTLAALVLTACAGSQVPRGVPVAENPLASAGAGLMLCRQPNTERKRCNSLSRYDVAADGAILDHATVTMSVVPPIVMATTSAVALREGAICVTTRPQDLDAAAFFVAGRPASREHAQSLRARLKDNIQARALSEICSTLVRYGERLAVDVEIDGTPHPELTEPVLWVKAGEGYTVGP